MKTTSIIFLLLAVTQASSSCTRSKTADIPGSIVVSDERITISIDDHGYSSVVLGSNRRLEQWELLSMEYHGEHWQITLDNPKRKFEYAFLIDGSWQLDPSNPIATKDSLQKSVVEL